MENFNSNSDNLPEKSKEMEELEKLGQRIREMQLELDFLEGTYIYSKSTIILDPDLYPVKIKFHQVLKKKWSIMCYQN